MVKYLVEHEADVNCKTKKKESVLHYAAQYSSLEMVKFLVEYEVDVHCKTKDNESVLHYAAKCKSGSLEKVKYLVEHGADVNCKTKENESVLHYAIRYDSLKMVKYLVENGADVNFKTERVESVLHYAARYQSLEMVKYLVEHGADVNLKTKKNKSVLHFAARYHTLGMVKYLVENGAKVTTEECKGNQTVLFDVVNFRKGGNEIVDYLLSHGAVKDIHDCDRSGRSLLSIACYAGNTALVQTLLKYKFDVRKERELVCRNHEIAKIINMELQKSVKHQEKLENLKHLDDEKLKKVQFFLCTRFKFCCRVGDCTDIFSHFHK